MKALTLWQPWASLIALGAKSIETRSWSTSYRGELLICAAARRLRPGDEVGEFIVEDLAQNVGAGFALFRTDGGRSIADIESMLPLGAAVAVATLVDCLPISDLDAPARPCLRTVGDQVFALPPLTDRSIDMALWNQMPYGDFTRGRFGWLLENIRPLPTPIPVTGRQQLWNPPDDVIPQVREQIGAPT